MQKEKAALTLSMAHSVHIRASMKLAHVSAETMSGCKLANDCLLVGVNV